MDIPVFIVNLPDATARREAILSQCHALGLHATLVEAVDGRHLSPEELASCYNAKRANASGRELSRPEIGCALSHLKIYRQILENNLPCALVLEDDAQPGKNLPEVLREVAKKTSPETPSVILFSHLKYYVLKNAVRLDCGAKIVFPYPKRNAAGAYGYFVTRTGARLLLENLSPVWKVSDDWTSFVKDFQLKLKAIVPCCVGIGEFGLESNIENGRSRNVRKSGLSYCVREYFWKRFLHRLLVLPFAAKKQEKPDSLKRLSDKNNRMKSLKN
ncbi:MAG: glycosyltransferase family 25 protein [Puniceicoccales bacterium]|jgi:glycosyl transferase family 25|nr:glycosyltransferase family 25 protein [Puniceicoccales bacterium]